MSTGKPILDSWLRFAAAHPQYQQFGQSGDVSTFNGGTGCTHTCFQRLIHGITGKSVTQDQISRVCHYPWPRYNRARRGMRSPIEGMAVVRYYKLPYRFISHPTWAQITAGMNLGPVLIGVKYDWWPEWRGCRYNGYKADGRPGGFALKNGKTQLVGFYGGHAVLALGYNKTTAGYRAYVNEPNHGSPSRPERPAYDVVTTAQLKTAMAKIATLRNGHPFAYVPIRAVKAKGY